MGEGCRVNFLYIGGCILFDTFCQFLVLDRVEPGSKDIMEELEKIIGFQKIVGYSKGLVEVRLVEKDTINILDWI